MHVPAKTDYEYPSPLKGYENHPALPEFVTPPLDSIELQQANQLNDSEKASDGKSYINPPAGNPSPSYDKFEDPIDNGIRGGFDIHIYYDIVGSSSALVESSNRKLLE